MRRELLPELISDILLRLPAQSLLRCRCLSNSLRDEIDSSNFAQIHLKRSIDTKTHRKLIITNLKDFYAADFDEGLNTALEFSNQFPDQEEYSTTSILNSCRGLILLRLNSSTPEYALWNPSTRQFKMLPHCSGVNLSRPRCNTCCLGYDYASGDYKVFRMIPDDEFAPTNYGCRPH